MVCDHFDKVWLSSEDSVLLQRYMENVPTPLLSSVFKSENVKCCPMW